MEAAVLTAPKGRPREFCTEQALAAALRVFWTKGFEGASMTDLTEAMGITRPSLYAAYGNKEALFRKALDLYEREKLAYIGLALEAPTARAVVERMLEGALMMQTSNGGDPKGCMGVVASVACAEYAPSIRDEVMARRVSSQRALIARFERARDEGELPEGVEPAGLADLLFAIMQGMAVQAAAGASTADLRRVMDTGLKLWPTR